MSKPASRRTSGSDLKRVDAHVIKPHEYKELPELTSAMLARAVVNKGGRPKSPNPRQLISLRLPPEVIETPTKAFTKSKSPPSEPTKRVKSQSL